MCKKCFLTHEDTVRWLETEWVPSQEADIYIRVWHVEIAGVCPDAF